MEWSGPDSARNPALFRLWRRRRPRPCSHVNKPNVQPSLNRSFWNRGSRGVGCRRLRSRIWSCGNRGCSYRRGNRSFDLHRSKNLLQAIEDLIAIHVLHPSFFLRDRRYVQRELVAGSVLEGAIVLCIVLTSAFSRNGFLRQQLGIANLKLARFDGGGAFGGRCFCR